MDTTAQAGALKDYLRRHPASNAADGQRIDARAAHFLARGEYSLNYRAGEWVIRLVTGSQMGYSLDRQVLYEYAALSALTPSGVTPAPLFVDAEPAGLPYPLLVEQYLPGRPLDYATDLAAAAECVAAIHALGVPREHRLQVHTDPTHTILDESREWAQAYLHWDEGDSGSKTCLREGFARVEKLLGRSGLFTENDLAIVNYDLNTHNFVVDDGRARLLDWEKARIAPRTEDLGHFLLPTTTLWRDETAALLTPQQESLFIDTYLARSDIPDHDRFIEQLQAMRIVIALRAVSWCSWALYADASGKKAISNSETLTKARKYLEPSFLGRLLQG